MFFALHNVAPNPATSQLVNLTKAAARRNASDVRHAPYVPKSSVQKLLSHLLLSPSLSNLRLAAAVALCYTGSLRIGECLTLNLKDVISRKNLMELVIRGGKTDRSRLGQRATIHCSNSQLSPHKLLSHYLRKGGLKLGSEGAIFRGILYNSQSHHYTLTNKRLTYNAIRKQLTDAWERAGLSQDISWHSFRAGSASRALNHGAPEELVKEHGRWRSSEGMAPYIKRSRQTRTVVPNLLSL
ncbi:MAG: tyrosine-type recombinase/integrase [Gammaproteobacteria bacterium]|nr:tyrosine-type recombinase/integrase [Gammaproteobacteria bacterium]